jgi:hypothetical protein
LVVGPADNRHAQEADRIAAGGSRVTEAQHPAHCSFGLDEVRVHTDPNGFPKLAEFRGKIGTITGGKTPSTQW